MSTIIVVLLSLKYQTELASAPRLLLLVLTVLVLELVLVLTVLIPDIIILPTIWLYVLISSRGDFYGYSGVVMTNNEQVRFEQLVKRPLQQFKILNETIS